MGYKDKDKRRAYDRQYHANRTDETKARKVRLQRDRKRKTREWLNQYKRALLCQCGENHPACLDFHHNDSSRKEMAISNAVQRGWSIARITAELEKCIVLCANCHRKLHSKETRDSDGENAS